MIRVLIVDDSPIARDVLGDMLQQEGDVRVVGTAPDGEAAVRCTTELRPDVVTMDIQMPGGGGLTAIEQIMAHCPVPIVVVTSLAGVDPNLPFEAMSRGALEVAVKPATAPDAAALRAAVRRVAGIPVIRHVRGLRAGRLAAAAQVARASGSAARIIGIGASAGGPAALDVVLGALPATLPACVALVQHLPPGFVPAFADYLRARTPLEVVLVQPGPGVEARPGTLMLAAGDHHLAAVSPRLLAAVPDPPLRGHRPSATVLFRSLAKFVGDRAVGAILTGIGDDGAAGLLELRTSGGATFGQDRETSTVYGMPQAAFALGAVERVLPLGELAPALRRAVGDTGAALDGGDA